MSGCSLRTSLRKALWTAESEHAGVTPLKACTRDGARGERVTTRGISRDERVATHGLSFEATTHRMRWQLSLLLRSGDSATMTASAARRGSSGRSAMRSSGGPSVAWPTTATLGLTTASAASNAAVRATNMRI
eukprot:5225523-Prymnesium_polylepis.1